MKKSKYSVLFDEAYSLYLSGNTNKNWTTILKLLDGFIINTVTTSKVYFNLRESLKAVIIETIYRAFGEYDKSKGASIYTWSYLLCKQAIWKFIRDNSNPLIITDAYDEDGKPVNVIDQCLKQGPLVYNKEKEDVEVVLKTILKEILKGPVELDVFVSKKGLFGEDKKSLQDIINESEFDEKTIKLINGRNNKSLTMFRKYLKEFNIKDIDSFNVEHYKKWRKTHKY